MASKGPGDGNGKDDASVDKDSSSNPNTALPPKLGGSKRKVDSSLSFKVPSLQRWDETRSPSERPKLISFSALGENIVWRSADREFRKLQNAGLYQPSSKRPTLAPEDRPEPTPAPAPSIPRPPTPPTKSKVSRELKKLSNFNQPGEAELKETRRPNPREKGRPAPVGRPASGVARRSRSRQATLAAARAEISESETTSLYPESEPEVPRIPLIPVTDQQQDHSDTDKFDSIFNSLLPQLPVQTLGLSEENESRIGSQNPNLVDSNFIPVVPEDSQQVVLSVADSAEASGQGLLFQEGSGPVPSVQPHQLQAQVPSRVPGVDAHQAGHSQLQGGDQPLPPPGGLQEEGTTTYTVDPSRGSGTVARGYSSAQPSDRGVSVAPGQGHEATGEDLDELPPATPEEPAEPIEVDVEPTAADSNQDHLRLQQQVARRVEEVTSGGGSSTATTPALERVDQRKSTQLLATGAAKRRARKRKEVKYWFEDQLATFGQLSGSLHAGSRASAIADLPTASQLTKRESSGGELGKGADWRHPAGRATRLSRSVEELQQSTSTALPSFDAQSNLAADQRRPLAEPSASLPVTRAPSPAADVTMADAKNITAVRDFSTEYVKMLAEECANGYDETQEDVKSTVQEHFEYVMSCLKKDQSLTIKAFWNQLKKKNGWPGEQQGYTIEKWIEYIAKIFIEAAKELGKAFQKKSGIDTPTPEQQAEIELKGELFLHEYIKEDFNKTELQKKAKDLMLQSTNIEAELQEVKGLNATLREALDGKEKVKTDSKDALQGKIGADHLANVLKSTTLELKYIHGKGKAPPLAHGFLPNTHIPCLPGLTSEIPGAADFTLKAGYELDPENPEELLKLTLHNPAKFKTDLPGYPDSVDLYWDDNLTSVRGVSETYKEIPANQQPHLRTWFYAVQGLTTSKHYLVIVMFNNEPSGAKNEARSGNAYKLREAARTHQEAWFDLKAQTTRMKARAADKVNDGANATIMKEDDYKEVLKIVRMVKWHISHTRAAAETLMNYVVDSSRHTMRDWANMHLEDFSVEVTNVISELRKKQVPWSKIEEINSQTPSTSYNSSSSGQQVAVTSGSDGEKYLISDLKLLPPQKLPLFDGKRQSYKKWKIDFCNFVGNRPDISWHKKYHYLRCALKPDPHLYYMAQDAFSQDAKGLEDLWLYLDSRFSQTGPEAAQLYLNMLRNMKPLGTNSNSVLDQLKVAEVFDLKLRKNLTDYREAKGVHEIDSQLLWADISKKIRSPFLQRWQTFVDISTAANPDLHNTNMLKNFQEWLRDKLLPDLRRKLANEQMTNPGSGGGGGGGGQGGGGNGRSGGNGGHGGSGKHGKDHNATAYITAATSAKGVGSAKAAPTEASTRSQTYQTKGQRASKNRQSRVDAACIVCKGNHLTRACPLEGVNLENLYPRFYSSNACTTCGCSGHFSSQCRSNLKCGVDGCQKSHLAILHHAPPYPYKEWAKKYPELARKCREKLEQEKKARNANRGKGTKSGQHHALTTKPNKRKASPGGRGDNKKKKHGRPKQ